MFVLMRLTLAHLLADFAFQTNFIYQLRIKYAWGVIVHSMVFAFFALVCLTPYLSSTRAWILILILWSTHTLFDKLKINYIISTGEDNIWWFLLDQVLHIIIITAGSMTLANVTTIDLPSLYHGIYYSDLFIKVANGYVFALFVPVALIYYIEKTVKSRAILYPTPYRKYTGVFERMAVMTFLLAGGVYYFFVPLVMIFSWYLQRLEYRKDSFLYPRMALSLLSSVLTSLWLLNYLQ